MNAQEKWKEAYRDYREARNDFEAGIALNTMRFRKREAALERKLAAAERTITAQAERIAELEVQVMEDTEREKKFDVWLSQALNEGDGIYRP